MPAKVDLKEIDRNERLKGLFDKEFLKHFDISKQKHGKNALKSKLGPFWYPGVEQDINEGKASKLSDLKSYEEGLGTFKKDMDSPFLRKLGDFGKKIYEFGFGKSGEHKQIPIYTPEQIEDMDKIRNATVDPYLRSMQEYETSYKKPYAEQILGSTLQERLSNLAANPEAFSGMGYQPKWPSQQNSNPANQQALAMIMSQLGQDYGPQVGQKLKSSAQEYGPLIQQRLSQGYGRAKEGIGQGYGKVQQAGNSISDYLRNLL